MIRVIGGDTLDTAQGRVRLVGTDTPERGERCASKATNRLPELAGDSIRLEDDRGYPRILTADRYWAVRPPSMTNSEPVTKDASSEARYRAP